MAARKIRGREMLLELEGGKLGCLSSVSMSLEREIITAACRQDGNFVSGEKGDLSGSISFDGLVIIDNPEVPANMRSADIIDIMLDDTEVPLTYVLGPGSSSGGDVEGLGSPGDIVGSKTLTGSAILSGLEISGDQDGMATYSGTLTLTSKPVHAVAV
jgi:hypothetical protein